MSDMGHVTFEATSVTVTTIKEVSLTLTNDKDEEHGIHIHQFGALGNECKNAGPHWNPTGEDHAGRANETRHIGDLGNWKKDGDVIKATNVEFPDSRLPMQGEYSIVGRGIVVHKHKDDLGTGGNKGSRASGNSGPRIACGVIGATDAFEIADKDAKNDFKKYPLKTASNFMSKSGSAYHGVINLMVDKDGKTQVKAELKGLPATKDYYIHLYQFGDASRKCDSLGKVTTTSALAKITANDKGDVSTTADVSQSIELIGAKSVIGKGIAISTDDKGKTVESCSVLGIAGDYSPGGSGNATSTTTTEASGAGAIAGIASMVFVCALVKF